MTVMTVQWIYSESGVGRYIYIIFVHSGISLIRISDKCPWIEGGPCLDLTWFEPYDRHGIIENLGGLFSQYTSGERMYTNPSQMLYRQVKHVIVAIIIRSRSGYI